MLYVYVDWRSIRGGEDLQTVDVGWEIRPETTTYADGSPFGTRITLTGLRTNWDAEAIGELGRDVWMLRSPFRGERRKTRGKTALDFYVDLNAPGIESARTHFDRLYDALFKNWKARIAGVLEDGRHGSRGTKATVTVEFAPKYPKGVEQAGTFTETLDFPILLKEAKSDVRPAVKQSPTDETSHGRREKEKARVVELSELDRARFEILVFKPVGRQQGGLSVREMREYLRRHGGVSVYDAGFRLPYYGSQDLSGHDWLNVGVDQGRRLMASELLPERLRIGNRYLLDLPNPGRIFGAVDVDTNYEHRVAVQRADGGHWLQIQPGRDRLAPNTSFEQLRHLVRFGLDFYANRYRAVADDVVQKEHAKEPPARALRRALSTLERYKTEMPPVAYRHVKRDVVAVRKAVQTESQAVDSRAALFAPLATAGMAALAMNHELAHDAGLLEDLVELLNGLAESDSSPQVEQALRALDDYQSRLEAYRTLFSPLADPEERKVVQRLRVHAVVSQVVRALRARLSGVLFESKGIAGDLLFPVGAFAEWSAILQNLLFNAWNAMLETEERIVRFDGSTPRARRQYLRVSDTGTGLAVPFEEAGMLFEPFERRAVVSPANRSIAIGGQGLGLAIVRMIAHSRGAEVAFVSPPQGFSTSIQISWKG